MEKGPLPKTDAKDEQHCDSVSLDWLRQFTVVQAKNALNCFHVLRLRKTECLAEPRETQLSSSSLCRFILMHYYKTNCLF